MDETKRGRRPSLNAVPAERLARLRYVVLFTAPLTWAAFIAQGIAWPWLLVWGLAIAGLGTAYWRLFPGELRSGLTLFAVLCVLYVIATVWFFGGQATLLPLLVMIQIFVWTLLPGSSIETGLLSGAATLAPLLWLGGDYLPAALIGVEALLGSGLALLTVASALDRESRERRDMAAIAAVSRALETLDTEVALQTAVDEVFRAARADSASIYLRTSDDRLVPRVIRLSEAHYAPEEREAMMRFHGRVGQGLTGWVAQHGVPLNLGDAERDPRAIHIPNTQFEDASHILVPLKVEGEAIGVLRIARRGLHQFDDDDLRLAQIFAGQIAQALEHARLYEEAKRLTVTDSMTDLFNARYFSDQLPVEVARHLRYGHPLSLLFVDSDTLKRVNDRYGHACGDRLVQVTASAIRQAVRETDVVFRYAGDEFLVLMPETNALGAHQVAERVLRAVSQAPVEVVGQQDLEAQTVFGTVSIGVATLPDHAQTAEELFRAADHAMYLAKATGGNAICVAERRSGDALPSTTA